MTERVPCKTAGCGATILPSTATETGGLCRPCANGLAAQTRARDLAGRRTEVDRFAAVTDVVEILRRIHCPPKSDPHVHLVPYTRSARDLYRALSQRDADRLVASAVEDPSLLRVVAGHLSCFTDLDRTLAQRALLDRADPYPPHAFRSAQPFIVDALFDRLARSVAQSDLLALDHALAALAFARTTHVIDAMAGWCARPPPWRSMLHIAPEEYATLAGYCIDGSFVHDLVLPTAVCIHPSHGTDESAVTVFAPDPHARACPCCHAPAIVLLSCSGSSLPRELGARVPDRVPTCVDCAYLGTVFVRLGDGDTWTWLSNDAPPREGGRHALPPGRAAISPRGAWEAVDWTHAEGLSGIGGHPSWIQEPHYPPCPSCAQRTKTIAQIGVGDFVEHDEGVFYVHHCARCAVVGVSYQQS